MALLSKDMLADLVINIANIVILFLITKALVYKPVKKFLTARKEKLEAENAKAEALMAEANEKQETYDALLADAQNEKARILQTARAEAQAQAEDILAAANADAEKTAAEAAAAAEEEKRQAVAGAKDEIAELAVALSGKIMGRAASDRDDLRAAAAFFEDPAV